MEYTRIIIRHDISENWYNANPILEEGEYGHDMTVNRFKAGDGVTDWNHLQWSSASYADITNLNNTVVEHVNNGAIHVTQSEKNTWNAKSDFSGNYNDLSNKPNLATVATSGSYNDLSNKPTIPSVGEGTISIVQGGETKGRFSVNQSEDLEIKLDEGGVTSVSWNDVTGKPNFATVATSGSYNDLSNKPTIPTVGDGTVTIVQGGETKGSFTMNQSGNTTITLGQGIASVSWDDVTNKPDFATVATSGSYDDLSDKPSIPTSTSQLTNDSNFVSDANYVHTDNNYTDSEKQKLSGISSGAQPNVQSNWNEANTSSDAYIQNKPSLAAVATSGAYSDLSGTPSLAAVATSGDYGDLSNTPSIPAAQVNSDWDAVSGVAQILHKPALSAVATSGAYSDLSGTPNLATVAESGSYTDLTDKPTIPTVNNATLTINQGGTLKGTFTANASSDVTIDLGEGLTSVDWDDVTNKPTFATVATSGDYTDLSNTPNLATVATSGSYNDLSNKPSIPTVNNATLTITQGGVSKGTFTANASSDVTIALGEGLSSVSWDDVTDKPNFATVATSGSYNDLSNKPTIPDAQVQSNWTESNSSSKAYIQNKPSLSAVATSGLYSDLTGTPSLATVATSGSYTDLTDKPSIPTVNDATLTITQGGVNKGTFTANASSNVTIALDAGGGSVAWNDITGKPTFATVATSGSYSDLSNQPTILDSSDFKTINSNSIVGSGDITIKPYQQNTVTVSSATSLAVNENTVYKFTGYPTQLTLASIPNSQYESDIYFTAGGNFTLGLPNGTIVYGSTSINNGENYAICIKDGQVVVAHDGVTSQSVAWNDITGKPAFATVATSGDYNDLSNKPSIPAAQVQSDWNAVSGMGEILNKPNLATVATTGSYSDLSNTPTIPTVNNATLTITQGGVSKGTFTANASSDVTIALDAGGGSVAWNDITGKPSFATVATTGDYTDLSNTPSLATVATSGSYNDLSNKPTIPAAQVNSNWNESDSNSKAYIQNKPTMQTYAITFTLSDNSTVEKTFWVQS